MDLNTDQPRKQVSRDVYDDSQAIDLGADGKERPIGRFSISIATSTWMHQQLLALLKVSDTLFYRPSMCLDETVPCVCKHPNNNKIKNSFIHVVSRDLHHFPFGL